ncbi:hypothetical protein [Escherichia coli]|uniref:hypothetical protein n=1 Tax=Escherichia coli TaxID=562 RepID=UPI0025523133|nr:hypothetical protein [Escherichia coli]
MILVVWRFRGPVYWYSWVHDKGDESRERPVFIIGNDGNNLLAGGQGGDYIEGAGGNDKIEPGKGANRVDGGVNATIFNRYLPFSCPLRYFRY